MADSKTLDHRAEYQSRLEARTAWQHRCQRRAQVIANLRLLLFGIGVGVAWFSFGTESIDGLWLFPPAAGFFALVWAHDREIRSEARAGRAILFYERGLSGFDDRWRPGAEEETLTVDGEEFLPDDHPCARDLDLLGEGSLFVRLCVARTRDGQRMLADWLLQPAPAAVIRSRQRAVAELAERLDLREEFAIVSDWVREHVQPEALSRWGEAGAVPPAALYRGMALVLSMLTLTSLAGWLFGAASVLPFAMSGLLQSLFAIVFRAKVQSTLRSVDLPVRQLGVLARLLACVETQRFEASELVSLQERLLDGGQVPSERIAVLLRWAELLEARQNQFFAPLGALMLWTTQLSFALEVWRARSGPQISGWIREVAQLEALCSLAGYAYENPDQPFPEIVEGAGEIHAEGLAHPLLPRNGRVANDLSLGRDLRLLVVSGSNMSGKSTLLRSVGVNLALAYAGAPVCATRLRVSPLVVAASIRVDDSLLDGTSRFYAEIKRLRQIVELAEESRRALFLIDEMLHGTNSHDRGIGANAVIRGLVERGALGLVTTHDLVLTRVTDDLDGAGANVHFQDHLHEGQMSFDYRMRPGVVEKSNALALMRSVGLEV
ncbi:DNA mismatch repair protein MutS [Myxococcota bacterium]|nr:DNA mismatch repair protein MutS [Myxococcota bacterium]